MYLVAVCCQMDDIPLRIFGERDAAVDFARTQDGTVPEAILEILVIDQPVAMGISVWDFDGSGLCVKRDHIRWFCDERKEKT